MRDYIRTLKEMPVEDAKKVALQNLRRAGLVDKNGNPSKQYRDV
jgi:hypothetical protein